VPVVFLIYYNPVFARGAERFLSEAADAGVTGVREALPPGAVELLRRVRARAEAPTALGFGIGSPEAAAQAAGEADGVIIGSKLMQVVEEEGPEGAARWLGEVRRAVSGAARPAKSAEPAANPARAEG
jgi:tryptophan synthase alpha chain